ncbi:MAG: hypothetical protein SF029_05555 [bacterium]|nr:hypothetical protein [bacterium]
MRKIHMLSLLLFFLFTSGMVLAQSGTGGTGEPEGEGDISREISFEVVTEIGRALPRNLLYDPMFEQMLVIDAYGKLMLVDALTYETKYTLYESGSYSDFAFSHNGRWLAVALDRRIDLWDTQSGTLAADLSTEDLGAPIQTQGPITFSEDDNLLLFIGLYPAPRSIRRSENDTSTVPWLWHLPAARNEAESTFPDQREAWQFFDYRFGFVLGPESRIVAALPGRLEILDGYTLENLYDIATDRYEQDPLTVFFSQRDNRIYVQPVNQAALIQVDTQRGVLVEVPLNTALTLNDLETLGGVELGSQARVIGEAASRTRNPLLRVLLDSYYGQDYRRAFENHPLTVTLIDVLVPPAATDDLLSILFFIYDEQEQRGRFVISRPNNVQQMVPNADDTVLLVRQTVENQGEFIKAYDFTTGQEILSLVPALRDLGGYSRFRKNRILAYDQSGQVVVSDFQRFNAETGEVLAEDLRYSRRFERFFFTEDSANVVTLSGTEWRLWSLETGEVVRREVLRLNGTIADTASDGSRFLTYFDTNSGAQGAQVSDLNDNTQRQVVFDALPGRFVAEIYPSPNWERFLVLYSENSYGPYYPGNEIAMYDIEDGRLWFIAGDDLPPVDYREYGWVDNETVYVIGDGVPTNQPARVFGVEADASGLPACIVDNYPDQFETYANLWERLTLNVRPDALATLSLLICENLPDNPQEVEQLLLPTSTPLPVTLTPIRIEGIPVCLTGRYPDRAEEFAAAWREITEGLTEAQMRETETLLCEGIGEFNLEAFTPAESVRVTMLIDAESGLRSTGSFTPILEESRPFEPIRTEFERTEQRDLGQAILSPNEQLIAASSLPGELVIYRMIVSYRTLLSYITQTASENLAQQNLIGVLPSPTPTYNPVGTARPTLTPTTTPTPFPRPAESVDQPQRGEVVDLCPSDTFYDITSPPEGYNPTGRISGEVQGDFLWRVEPESGQRLEDQSLPQCGSGLDCVFSPDREWILATMVDLIFVVRPDNSDIRVLFAYKEDGTVDEEVNPLPENIFHVSEPPQYRWSGRDTLEFDVEIQREDEDGYRYFEYGVFRDILGVFPDPEPFVPLIQVNEIDANLEARQPGGPLAVVSTTFSTGIGPGYKYYIYNTETGDYRYFARVADEPGLTLSWHPLGDRLFYYYYAPSGRPNPWYQFSPAESEHALLGDLPGGVWSNEGRYRAYSTGRRTQQIGVYDSQSGLTRTYCLPELGARIYNGPLLWSPDSRYLALLAPLPADENVEGVGQHVLIVDVQSGAVIDLTTGFTTLVDWSREPGEYGGN